MLTDPELITAARAKAKQQSAARQEEIERAIDDYEAACELSRGKDRERAAHWTPKARSAKRLLERLVKPVAVAKAAGRVS
jgi:hypothetical protein